MLALSTAGLVHGAPAEVDTTDALVIGTYRISAYRVDKNYRRAIASTNQPGAGSAGTETTRAWFARFLVDQVLTAHALKEGYGERPEVSGEVRHMERHMLTQFAGPFYEHLYSEHPAPEPALDSTSACRQSNFDLEILRVPSAAPIARQIRNIFALKASDDPEPDLAAIMASGQSEYFSGSIAWPFAPFEEIASAVCGATIGHWQQLQTNDTLLFFRVRSARPIVGQVGSPPIELWQHLNQRRIQKERQQQIIQEAGLTFDWPTAQRWVDKLTAQRPDSLLPLDQGAATDMLAVPLASFHGRIAGETVTVADYINYYNDLYIRSLPRNALDVYNAVQAMVVAQRDYDDARALGIDRAPKFTEDRRNYRDLLALDLYLKERIRPALGISDSDISRYYAVNTAAFTRPTRIEGSILTFDVIDDAIAFAQASDSEKAASHARNRETLVLTPTTVLQEMGFLPGLVFSNPTARALGPFPNARGFAIWVFERVIDSETRPLIAVSQEIRSRLEQPYMEQHKAELARKLSRDAIVEDKISYIKYGIGELAIKPWNP